MVLGTDKLRARLSPGSQAGEASDAVVAALDGRIEADEPVLYRLPGKDDLRHEHDGESQTIAIPAGGKALAVVTDRRLLFVLAGEDDQTVVEVSHLDLKDVDADDGLLRSKLTVEVWNEGSYSLRTAGGDTLGATVGYLRDAAACWQQVVAALDDASEQTNELGERLEAGELEAAREAREAATAKLDRAATKLDQFGHEAPAPLSDRLAEARTDLAQTQIRGHFARAKTLMTEAQAQTDAGAYTGAFRSYWHARDHLETALSTARRADISKPAVIDSKLDTIETRLDHLRVRPTALARQAVERAEGTDKLDVEVDAWQAAFEHYRDALTAGWGTEIEFAGDTRDIRFQTEVIIANLIDARRRLAAQYEEAGDEADDAETAESYDQALEQLEAAREFASEFRSGDPERLERHIERVAAKRYGQD
jgi:tetratricopeptide (TPR) repeat protein